MVFLPSIFCVSIGGHYVVLIHEHIKAIGILRPKWQCNTVGGLHVEQQEAQFVWHYACHGQWRPLVWNSSENIENHVTPHVSTTCYAFTQLGL